MAAEHTSLAPPRAGASLRPSYSARIAPTALVIPAPTAEAAIGSYRRKLTVDGADGMPAHVTLLFPFVDASELDPFVDLVDEVAGRFRAFTFSLDEVGVFSGPPFTLYLAPSPRAPFAEMTDALARAFPDYPPYAGRHPEVVPHLTVAESDDEALLAEIRGDVRARLPLAGLADEVLAVRHGPDGWQVAHRIALRDAG